MAINFDRANVHVRQLIKPKIHSAFCRSKPLLAILAGNSIAGMDKLGDPKMGVVWGGAGIGRATMLKQVGSYQHEFRFQTDEPDDAEFVGMDGDTPVATKFSDDLTDKAATRWTDMWIPLKVRKDRADAARGNLAVGSLMEEAVNFGMNKDLKKHQAALWTGTLTEAQQDEELWDTYLGVQHTCDGSGTDWYAGKSRSVHTVLRGNEFTAAELATAGAIVAATTKPTMAMFRYLRTVDSLGGIANKYTGAGLLSVTTPELWTYLSEQAESKHRIYQPGEKIPGVLRDVSMEYPVIQKDQTLITYDPDCPSGELYLLTPDFWVFEVEQGNNFVVEEWAKKWMVDEGGKKYYFTYIHAKTRLTCYRPDLQTKITGLTTT